MSKPTSLGATVSAKDLPRVIRLDGRQNSQGTISLKVTKRKNNMYWVTYNIG